MVNMYLLTHHGVTVAMFVTSRPMLHCSQYKYTMSHVTNCANLPKVILKTVYFKKKSFSLNVLFSTLLQSGQIHVVMESLI